MASAFARRVVMAAFDGRVDLVLSTRAIHDWIHDRYPRVCPSIRQLAMVLSRMPGVMRVESARRRTASANDRVALWRLKE